MSPFILLALALFHITGSLCIPLNAPGHTSSPLNITMQVVSPGVTNLGTQASGLEINPFHLPRRWPRAPFSWKADDNIILHFNSYESENIRAALEEGLQNILTHYFLYHGFRPGTRLLPEVVSLPCPPSSTPRGSKEVVPNVEVQILNNDEQPGMAYTAEDVEMTLFTLIKKIQTSKFGHYTVVEPEIRGVRYKKISVQRAI